MRLALALKAVEAVGGQAEAMEEASSVPGKQRLA